MRILLKTIIYILIGLLGSFITASSLAQSFSIEAIPYPEILVSSSRSSANSLGHDLEKSLVYIIASDAETLQAHNGTIALGSQERKGQGIIIDSTGVIVTNKHIIGDNPQHIHVILADGERFEAELLQHSQADDLSLIKINTPFPLRAISLGDPSQIQIGNRVIALTNEHVYSQRKKSGEVIQVYRNISTNDVAILEMNIQLQAGDSGGPILNEQGLLLGLILANQISDTAKSYAIASNKIQKTYLKYRNSTLISRL